MLLSGFIKMDRPKVLINPVMHRNDVDLYVWLASFFNDENFSLDGALTQASVNESLLDGRPILIAINGYNVAIMFGEESVIKNNTERFFYTEKFSYTDYMAN